MVDLTAYLRYKKNSDVIKDINVSKKSHVKYKKINWKQVDGSKTENRKIIDINIPVFDRKTQRNGWKPAISDK